MDRFEVNYITGRKVAIVLRDASSGNLWNFSTSAWVSYAPGSDSQFAQMLTEQAVKEIYEGPFPALPLPIHGMKYAYEVAGTTWSNGDKSIGSEEFAWNGFQLVNRLTNPRAVVGYVEDPAPTVSSFLACEEMDPMDDFYCKPHGGMMLLFNSGRLTGQNRQVKAYNGTTKQFTTDPFPVAPANGDFFELIAGY